MKYLITESQIENLATMYLDNQDFIQVKAPKSIYFMNSKDDEYAQIRYDKNDGLCYVSYDLLNEISSFFSLQNSDSEKIIIKWIENAINMEVKRFGITLSNFMALKVPWYN
jgi:hypothetical protein